MKIEFYLRFKTQYGQAVFVSGNLASLGGNDTGKAFPLQYLNDEFWYGAIEVDASETNTLHYRYIFTNLAGESIVEGERHRSIDFRKADHDLLLIDSWNDESFYENAFYTAPFQEVFFKEKKSGKAKKEEAFTHLFKVKAPLLQPNEAVCLLGSSAAFGSWDSAAPILLTKKGLWWTLALNLTNTDLPVSYKYGVINAETGALLRFEDGDNRVLFSNDIVNKKTIVHDAFVRLPNTTWKGAGVAIPVFSLRS
ncbi:MAG: 4-alpha-glucanotransferase, partial [Chitinophagaceae bacterium]